MTPSERIDQAAAHAAGLAKPRSKRPQDDGDEKKRADAVKRSPAAYVDAAAVHAAGLARVKRTDERQPAPAPAREYRDGTRRI